MKTKSILIMIITMINTTSADIIRGIDIEFVAIGYSGNTADTRDVANPYGCGAVDYEYLIGKYEVTNAQWDDFVLIAGAPTGNPSEAYNQSAYYGAQQATNCVSWYETLQFCNYLTSGDKSKGVYLFSGNNVNAGDFLAVDRAEAQRLYGTIYFLPTEDEWYKAAYYKPDGSGYSLYANGQNTIPAPDNGWNYYGGEYSIPWDVGTGTEEQNGTFDMMGNVWEWNETLLSGSYRGFRGSAFNYNDGLDSTSPLRSSYRDGDLPSRGDCWDLGFRIASIPEPATFLLLFFGAVTLKRTR